MFKTINIKIKVIESYKINKQIIKPCSRPTQWVQPKAENSGFVRGVESETSSTLMFVKWGPNQELKIILKSHQSFTCKTH